MIVGLCASIALATPMSATNGTTVERSQSARANQGFDVKFNSNPATGSKDDLLKGFRLDPVLDHSNKAQSASFTGNSLKLMIHKNVAYQNLIMDDIVAYGRVTVRAKYVGVPGAIFAVMLGEQGENEIDIEIVGQQMDQVQTMHYWRRIPIFPNLAATFYKLDKPLGTNFIDMGFDYTPNRIDWYIDGRLQRTVKNYGLFFPKNTKSIRLGVWANPKFNGWAGTFPENGEAYMEVESIKFVPMNDPAYKNIPVPAPTVKVEQLPYNKTTGELLKMQWNALRDIFKIKWNAWFAKGSAQPQQQAQTQSQPQQAQPQQPQPQTPAQPQK
ncbi:CRH- protein [Tieghemiomyces parasiticus]|uniref:CRH- protein n=1 Tax=Tieghemiomyces parasiticus TaxID=78921 RepID=A0A9W8AES4_9FUNG|nr:CRH- protein [Tieghemiomyces parasiticus]